jgi:hypothetical protein
LIIDVRDIASNWLDFAARNGKIMLLRRWPSIDGTAGRCTQGLSSRRLLQFIYGSFAKSNQRGQWLGIAA